MKALQLMIKRRFSKELKLNIINEYCEKITFTRQGAKDYNRENIRVSCVQRKIRPVKNIEEYIDIIYGFVEEAVDNQSHILIFPEYNFIDLLGLVPGFRLINYIINKRAISSRKKTDEQKENNSLTPVSPMLIFEAIAEIIEKGVEKLFSLMALKAGIYIYSGSYIIKENEIIYNVGSLFGPDGQLIGKQKKLHLTPVERQFGMGMGTELYVYDLPFGRVAFPVCMDATYFETFRICHELGVDIVIIPIANPEEYNFWKALKGIWPRVQESYVFGLKAALTGWLAGTHYTGKAGIFAPIEMTPEKDGILAISLNYEGDQLITHSLNINSLKNVQNNGEYFGDRNFDFERDYVKRVYFKELK